MILTTNEKFSANEDPMKTWKRVQVFMGNPQKTLDTVKNFKGESIDEKKLEQTYAIINDPANVFTEENLNSKNFAAGKLASWILNITTFNRIYKQVKPLQDTKDAAVRDAEGAQKALSEAREKVRKANESKAEAQKQLDGAILQKQAVEADAQKCQDKLDAALRLVQGLAGENKRWTQSVKDLKQNRNSAIGDSFLAASFVSYIGPFSAGLRKQLWQEEWMGYIKQAQIPMSDGVEPLKILTNNSEMANWKNNRLPADQMSLENAAIITKCSRWPLMIDPQLQGSTWIREQCKEGLITFSLTQDRWIRRLIDAIQMGRTVMIENLGQDLDATLEPLLSRAIVRKGNSAIIELGGDPIDYDLNFRLYLQTKLSNPHYRPEVAAQCTIINFIVTEGGLEDQLLAMVVKVERPELEDEKSQLVKKLNNFQVELSKLEAELLYNLSSAAKETILDNKELTDSLDKTKTTSLDIESQQEQAKITEAEINTQREIYRKVAAEGSMLYFLIISLNFVNHMYQYSLESFTKFFFKAIERTTARDETRVDELRKNIRYTIYQWVSRGLFERHKLILLSMITFRLMQKKVIDASFDAAQMHFLLTCIPKPGVECSLDWLPIPSWNAVQRLCDLEEFRSFAQNLEKDAPSRFKDWYNELEPENQKLPLDWKKLEKTFQKLLVLRCLRPDRLTVALTQFIRDTLPDGASYVEMDQKLSFNEVLASSLDDADPNIPLFFILSAGADPVKDVEKIARKKGFESNKNLWIIALGDGVEQTAMNKLELANKEGHWVMLQNIHLMPRWLIELEKKLDAFQLEGGGNNPAFRLFLSAEPSSAIPIGILDRSIKLTNEPPAGLKANMKRAWTYFPKEDVEDKDTKMKSILFALCFFHATVIERRKFGPKGWNMFYPFSIGDLRDSCLVLNKYFENISGTKIPWDDLTYIFGEIMYGGHIVDDWDRRLCKAYLEYLMNKGLFEEGELFPYVEGKNISFKSPASTTHELYLKYIEDTITTETPLAYGLHPNTEIGFRTAQCTTLFETLVELQPPDSSSSNEESSAGVRSKQDIVTDVIKLVLEDYNLKNEIFTIDDIKTRIEDKGAPYQNVFLQECEYMNVLVVEIIKSMEELSLGFQGLLTVSEKMEQLIDAIALDRVPKSWVDLAYPSKRGLGSWFQNLLKRIEQLRNWKDDPNVIPKVTMLNRLFNPQSFLTAIKQVVGRRNQWELNKILIQTDVMKKAIEEIDSQPKEGAYVYGFVIEGARWDVATGQLEESRPREMFSVIPVTYCRAVLQQQEKEERGYYYCPVYKTEDRGGVNFVFTAQLKTKFPPRKWTLAGVAILLDVEGVEEVPKKKEQK